MFTGLPFNDIPENRIYKGFWRCVPKGAQTILVT
jgi:hypothetical protein